MGIIGIVDGSYNGSVPVGTINAIASSTIPSGFLKCDGSLISRTTYSALFAIISTTYGDGDGSTTFKLPDLRGEFIRGLDDGRGVDTSRALGTSQSDELKAHTHTTSYTGTSTVAVASGSFATAPQTLTTGTGSTGGTETRPRNVAMVYVIKY